FNINSEIIVISDSDNNNDSNDDDELPSLETVLKNITKFAKYKKINNNELIKTHNSKKAFNVFMGVLKKLIVNAKPTATYYFIKKLANLKKLKRVYTQNLDNLKELVELYIDWQFEKVKNCQAHQGEAPNCPGYEIRETSLRILGVNVLIKNFARAIYGCGSFMILVNATDVVTKEWNGIIDYQIEGTCDKWVKLVGTELSNVKTAKLLKRKLAKTNNKSHIEKKERENIKTLNINL
ncbi:3277_t:CDS:2, partial [Gigaspora margarita]